MLNRRRKSEVEYDGKVVQVVGGKYKGDGGQVYGLTPEMVYVTLHRSKKDVRVWKSSVKIVGEKGKMTKEKMAPGGDEVREKERVNVIGGKYAGIDGVVMRLTKCMVYVQLRHENGFVEVVRLMKKSVERRGDDGGAAAA